MVVEQPEAQEMQIRWRPQDFARQALEAAVEDQGLELVVAQVAQVDSLLLAEQAEELLALQQEHLAAEVRVEQGWQSSQLISKHELRSHFFRNKHRGRRHRLGWRHTVGAPGRMLR